MLRPPMNLDEFKVKFEEIKSRGFIKTTRNGPTGVGHTFETVLGYTEDNIALPDLGEVELKARRINSHSMVTLFTHDRKAWVTQPLQAIRKYGTPDENGRLGMYFTMSRNPNNSGVYLDISDDKATVKSTDGTEIASWSLDALANKFCTKIPGLVLVNAESKFENGVEHFHYVNAQVLRGTSPYIIRQNIENGNIMIDLRLHDKGTSARNHGTGFRILEDRLPLLFSSSEKL